MQERTGDLYSQEEFEAMSEQEQEGMHPIGADTKVDTIHKLQKNMMTSERRQALKALKRKQNKMQKQSRKQNRKKK